MRRGPADVNKPELDSKGNSATKVVRALDSSFRPSLSNQPCAPLDILAIGALRSGRQIGRETYLKKVFQLSTRTAVNSSGKYDLAATGEADEPNGLAEASGPPGKVAHRVAIIDSSIEGELDRLNTEVIQSRQTYCHP